VPHPTTARELLVRAAVAQRFAASFRYPRAGTCAAILEAVRGVLPAAADGSADLRASVGRLAAALEEADDARLQAEYSQLFIGSDAAPLHETGYGPPRLTTAAELADVQGFYRAFGFELSADAPEMADHLGAELEFHAALLAKLAWADVQELAEAADVTAHAAASFLDAHLGRWVAMLAERLHDVAPESVYSRAAAEAAAFVTAECGRFGVRPSLLGPRGGAGEADVFTCPHASGEGRPPS
jgi:putative dimethyl sulfoxide reductase chaperone